MYDASVGRWNGVDALAEKYINISPFVYTLNSPINAIDPDGKRVYFVAGAGGDQSGWNYTERIGTAFSIGGISGFQRIPNISRGKMADRLFVFWYRNSSTLLRQNDSPFTQEYINHKEVNVYAGKENVKSAIDYIEKDLQENPLEDGEQLNLGGISYGAIVQSHASLALADKGIYVDNVILMSSPSGKNSELISRLRGHKNIGQVHIINPENDLVSDTGDIIKLLRGVVQNLEQGDDAPHLDQARPEIDTWLRLIEIVENLKEKGVK